MSSTPFRDTVSTEDSNDELIRERAFKISESIELADIIIPIDEQETEDVNEIEHVDEALQKFSILLIRKMRTLWLRQ